jgi:hypothetical protein
MGAHCQVSAINTAIRSWAPSSARPLDPRQRKNSGRLSDMAALGIVILVVINILVSLVLRLLYREEKKETI